MTEIALQLILAVMLALSTSWCVIVHHRLRKLKSERSELEGFIGDLAATVERAEAATQAIRSSSIEAKRDIEEATNAAERAQKALFAEVARAERAGDQLTVLLDRPLPERTSNIEITPPGPSRNGATKDNGSRSTTEDASRPELANSAMLPGSDMGRDELKRLLASLR